MTVFISQPMTGLGEADIIEQRGEAAEQIKKIYGDKVEICDSYHTDIEREHIASTYLYDSPNRDVYWLGRSIETLCWADLIWFTDGWENSRGCKIENMVASLYGIEKSFPTDGIRIKMSKQND